MEHQKKSVKIMWSVWDSNPTVSWRWDGCDTKITQRLPPVSVANLQRYEAIAIVGNTEEFGRANLMFYTYEGKLLRTYSAPRLGGNSQFSGVSERNGEVIAIVAYEADDGSWLEEAGKLSVETGVLTELHRSY